VLVVVLFYQTAYPVIQLWLPLDALHVCLLTILIVLVIVSRALQDALLAIKIIVVPAVSQDLLIVQQISLAQTLPFVLAHNTSMDLPVHFAHQVVHHVWTLSVAYHVI
jgi:hypothetical protein